MSRSTNLRSQFPVLLSAIIILHLNMKVLAQLPDEARRAWESYEQIAVRLCGVKKQSFHVKASDRRTSTSASYQQNQDCVRMDFDEQRNAGIFVRTLVQNIKYSFEIARMKDPESLDYLLEGYQPNPALPLPSTILPLRDSVFVGINPHYQIFDDKLTRVVSKNGDCDYRGVSIIPAGNVETLNGPRFKISFSGKYDTAVNNQQRRVTGHVLLDPSRLWCIESLRIDEAIFHRDRLLQRAIKETQMEFDSRYEQFPIVKLERTQIKGTAFRDKEIPIDTEIVTEFDLKLNDEDSKRGFFLADYGLPEPIDRSQGRSFPYFLLALAVFFAILAIVFSRRKRVRPTTVLGDVL